VGEVEFVEGLATESARGCMVVPRCRRHYWLRRFEAGRTGGSRAGCDAGGQPHTVSGIRHSVGGIRARNW